MTVVVAFGSVGSGRLRQIYLDEGEFWAQAGLEAVCDEEEFVGGREDGGVELLVGNVGDEVWGDGGGCRRVCRVGVLERGSCG